MGNMNGEIFRMNYINVNHLVRLYDANSFAGGGLLSREHFMIMQYKANHLIQIDGLVNAILVCIVNLLFHWNIKYYPCEHMDQ